MALVNQMLVLFVNSLIEYPPTLSMLVAGGGGGLQFHLVWYGSLFSSAEFEHTQTLPVPLTRKELGPMRSKGSAVVT